MMTEKMTMRRCLALILCAMGALLATRPAHAQFDYSAYGVLDFSYGRFENSGFEAKHRFNSNSLSASFVGVNAKYTMDGGWMPGVTLESFIRFQDFKGGRRDDDSILSRKAFVSLGSDYGTISVGRLQTFLFDTTTRFNAMGNSVGFSPAVRQVFLSGSVEGVQGDFYWNRAASYVSPTWEGLTGGVMYALGPEGRGGDLSAINLVLSRGALAVSLSAQRVHVSDGIADPTRETTWQTGVTYNFGLARLFGLYTRINDAGLEVGSHIGSLGTAVPIGPGTLQLQGGWARAKGPAVDRRHSTISGAYLYPYDSITDFYVVAMDDRVRNQTRGLSAAIGVRFRY